MAYVDQEKKAKIAAALKPVVPEGWKYSLAVRNHSTIVLTIAAAPVNLLRAMKATAYFDPEKATHADLNPYHYRNQFAEESVADTFVRIFGALNVDNHDRSDLASDYHDVGHYVDVNIGRWDKPFVVTSAPAAAAGNEAAAATPEVKAPRKSLLRP